MKICVLLSCLVALVSASQLFSAEKSISTIGDKVALWGDSSFKCDPSKIRPTYYKKRDCTGLVDVKTTMAARKNSDGFAKLFDNKCHIQNGSGVKLSCNSR